MTYLLVVQNFIPIQLFNHQLKKYRTLLKITRQTKNFCFVFLLHNKDDNFRFNTLICTMVNGTVLNFEIRRWLLKGNFLPLAKVALRFGCAKQSKNLERYLVGMSSKLIGCNLVKGDCHAVLSPNSKLYL